MASVTTRSATVAELHALDPFADRAITAPEVWICDLTDAALVLGSRQAPTLVDEAACRAAGLEVVRRRSGGGAVLLRPDAVVWIDVVLPHGVAPDDVRGSMVWLGERWADVLGSVAGHVAGEVSVHRGGLVDSEWSDLVCFAGVGPGEVLVDGRKFVGLSQRRTRQGLRIQGTLYRRPVTTEIPSLLVGPTPAAALVEPHVEAGLDAVALAEALAERLA